MKEQKALETAGIPRVVIPRSAANAASQVLPYFVLLMIMDLLARTGYQMAKSPVLPLFAESLGTGFQVSGAIVAVSTITGLIVSPLVGALSDLYGRRRLLLVGTAAFAFVPFVYLLIQTSQQLFVVRLIHGFATGIYGPVVTAMVADMCQRRRTQYIGWYRSVRTVSYLLGPVLGGFVLYYASFRVAWISVGVLGLLAFLPSWALPPSTRSAPSIRGWSSTWRFVRQQLLLAIKNPVLVALGSVQAALYLGLRASKAFLPLYAVSVGINPAQIGAVFSTQVAATLLTQPIGGYLGDRMGRKPVILIGLLLVSVALALMVTSRAVPIFVLLSVALGLGEALIMPSIATMGTELSDRGEYGSTLGILDAMDNVGKALGPIVAGLLLGLFSYVISFAAIAGILLVVAIIFCIAVRDLD